MVVELFGAKTRSCMPQPNSGQHHALALGGAENEIDRFLDALLIARLGNLPAGRDLQREFPADAEEIALITGRLIHGVTPIVASP